MKSQNTRETGNQAEEIANAYLLKKGYHVLQRNWYFGHLELDIIAIEKDELVIVEVKSRTGIGFDHPTEAISNKKMSQVIEAADAYITLINWTKDTRFDLITVVFTGVENYELEHYEDAFNPMA